MNEVTCMMYCISWYMPCGVNSIVFMVYDSKFPQDNNALVDWTMEGRRRCEYSILVS